MAGIEPINSAMSYTMAQPVAKAAEAQNATTEFKEGQPMETNAPQVDAETISLAKTQKEEDSEGRDSGNENKQQKAPMNDESIKQAMKELQKKQANFTSEFGIHEKTHRVTVKIVDKKTKEVIKELPPEKTLDMIAKMWEYAGLIVDEKR